MRGTIKVSRKGAKLAKKNNEKFFVFFAQDLIANCLKAIEFLTILPTSNIITLATPSHLAIGGCPRIFFEYDEKCGQISADFERAFSDSLIEVRLDFHI